MVKAIDLLRGEIDRDLAFLGCRDLSELGPHLLAEEPAGAVSG